MRVLPFVLVAYIAFGVWWARGGTMRATRANSNLGTPNAVAVASIVTLIVLALGWPYWNWKWNAKFGGRP